MTTEQLKQAIYAEMQEGKSLLEAKLAVMHYLNERVEVATSELRTELS